MSQKNVLIYFSRDGSTAIMAEKIAAKFDAELVKLQEKKPRRGFLISGFRGASGRRPELAGDPWAAVDGTDVVILGAPIWAGNGNPVLNSFLDRADLSGRKVVLFSLQADPQMKSSDKVLRLMGDMVTQRGGELIGARAFHGNTPGRTAAEDYLQKQLDSWDLKI